MLIISKFFLETNPLWSTFHRQISRGIFSPGEEEERQVSCARSNDPKPRRRGKFLPPGGGNEEVARKVCISTTSFVIYGGAAHKYPRNPCYHRRGLAGGTISPPLAQLFQAALATTRVRYGVMDDALGNPHFDQPSFFPSLPFSLSHARARFPFPPPPPPCVTPPCHGRCRLNNYPHGVLNSSLATWNPSTEFARPRCGTLRLDRAGALRGELLINTSGGRGRERDGLRSGSANFAAVIIQSGARHPQKGSTIKGWRIPRRSLLLLLLDITIKFRSCGRLK